MANERSPLVKELDRLIEAQKAEVAKASRQLLTEKEGLAALENARQELRPTRKAKKS